MIINKVGNRYKYYHKFESSPIEYDYYNKGLLRHIMSYAITKEQDAKENTILKNILNTFESSLIFALKYVDRLKNFKNYTKNNR